MSPTIPLNPDRKYVNKFTRGAPVEPDAHTLYSPSKKYFNRNDSSFPEAHGRASFSSITAKSRAWTFMLGSLRLHKLESIALARPPRRPFVDPVSAGIQFYRISRNFGRTVGFGLSPRPRCVRPRLLSFFFSSLFSTACGIMRRRIRQLSRNPPAGSRHGARAFRPMI